MPFFIKDGILFNFEKDEYQKLFEKVNLIIS